MTRPAGPNCWDCRYLRITWDNRRPYGCQYMGFESRILPCLEVMRADGRPCGAFVAKSAHQDRDGISKPVDQTTQRQDSGRKPPFTGINLII